jgi:hypothetical protein
MEFRDIDRRDFLKCTGLAGFSLFIPRFEKGIWKPKPKPDWELALIGPNGEVSGAGYARIVGSWADLFDPVPVAFTNKSALQFPKVISDWGEVYAGKLIENRKVFKVPEREHTISLTATQRIDTGCAVLFQPGHLVIEEKYE